MLPGHIIFRKQSHFQALCTDRELQIEQTARNITLHLLMCGRLKKVFSVGAESLEVRLFAEDDVPGSI